jgi:hypothetical protein
MRASVLAIALALTTAFAAPAMAHDHEKHFPMPAAEFEQHVDARVAHARARMEEAITQKNLTDEQAKEVRARFDAGVAAVEVEVQKAVEDGTVTWEEAKAVRAVAREFFPHHPHHQQGNG